MCGVEEVSPGLRAFVGLILRDHNFLCSYSGERFDATGALHRFRSALCRTCGCEIYVCLALFQRMYFTADFQLGMCVT